MYIELNKKIKEIFDQDTIIGTEILSSEKLNIFLKEYNISLPDDFKYFVTHFNPFYIKEDYYFEMKEKSSLTPTNGYEYLDCFYTIDIIDNTKIFFDTHTNSVMPIGESNGDYVCIGITPNNYGKIFYFYHEDEERKDGLYLIADSFTDFIMKFQYLPDNIINISYDPSDVILSKDLIKSIEKFQK
ncbi:MAG: SMI1/KNR4 family protein [Firmicutes bacterium]|nr:SMI1/KNR4 family protein [Bacillota bacterium]